MCIYTHIVHNMATVVGQKKFLRNVTGVNAECQGNLSACHFGHARHRFAIPVVA